MLAALLGRYFFVTATAALVLGFALPGDFAFLRPTTTWLLGSILFFSCLNVRLSDLSDNLTQPRALRKLLGLSAIKLLVLPLLAFVLASAVAPDWAAGLVLVSAMPAGLSSIAFTGLHRGNQALALLFVFGSSLLSPVTVPLLLALVGPEGQVIDARAMLGRALYILMVLVVPFLAAQGVRRFAPRFLEGRAQVFTRLAILSSCILVFVSTAMQRSSWAGWPIARFLVPLLLASGASLIFGVASLAVRRKLERADAIAFACGALYMNNGLAVLLALRFFPGAPRMLLPALLMQLPMLAAMAILGARSARAPLSQRISVPGGEQPSPP